MIDFKFSYTSTAQSQKILELGVPAASADFFRFTDDSEIPLVRNGKGIPLYPCWSVGRLIEIMALCYKFDFTDCGSIQVYVTDIKKGIALDILISDIERFINKIDFSKLEERI